MNDKDNTVCDITKSFFRFSSKSKLVKKEGHISATDFFISETPTDLLLVLFSLLLFKRILSVKTKPTKLISNVRKTGR